MNPYLLILGLPVLAAVLLPFIAAPRMAGRLSAFACGATFLASLAPLFEAPPKTAFFLLDDLTIWLVPLTAFITFTTSLFAMRYIPHEVEAGKLEERQVRLYHPLYQAFSFTMLLALMSNNIGVMWVAVEGATLATVLLIGIYRTPAALEASWKYFILCVVGIALALFGTTLIYLASQPVLGAGLAAMTWTDLRAHAADFNPALLNLAFVFLLVGYGTKVGLAPMHAWLPDAHAEGPTPISAVLSGLLLNIALIAILRFKALMAGNAGADVAGPLMIVLGLVSVIFAAFMLYRRRDIKRLFAYSSIEHMGIITFAFGVGGPLASFAGLLHMALHSLVKSALFIAVGQAAQARGTQKLAEIRGLTVSHPLIGWSLLFGMVAIAGMPPFGLFMSEFVLVTAAFESSPWLAALLVLGLLVSFGALMMWLQHLCFGPGEKGHPVRALPLMPVFAHLALALVAGLWLPEPLVAWFQNAAKLLG